MTATQAPGLRKGVIARLAAIDDGAILRVAFYAMLMGTVTILALDYLALSDRPDPMIDTASRGNPVLPALERPETDPVNPAFRPTERVTTPHETLSAPLEIALMPGGVLTLTGTIDPGSAGRFAQEVELRGEYVTTIALDSPGGVVEEALAMARLIREKEFSTAVGDGKLCASSCPLVLAGGAERLVSDSAAVGLHQIYAARGTGGEPASAQAMSDAQTTTARITRFLIDMDVDPALWLLALETPPAHLYYLTPEESHAYRLATEPALLSALSQD